jgi:hypothetical protein
MRSALIMLAAGAAIVTTSAQAQYYQYPPPPRGYYEAPRYYDAQPREYYGPPPSRRYYGPPPSYGRTQAYDPAVRHYLGNPNADPWRPRFDPRNGGYYCVTPGFTVQDGVCKPGRGW